VAKPQLFPDAPLSDPGLAGVLAGALRRAGFGAAALGAVFAGGREDSAVFEARAAELPPRLATALRLFVFGQTVTRADADDALGDGLAAGLALRALSVDDGVRATLRIIPHDVLFVASDLPSLDLADEHVAAAHAPSLTLARLTVRRRVARALDIGTGNGIQALLLAEHADHVVATDVSERALRFTELNAALNRRTNIETRAGSWLAPVEGERFDTVVCSPPYVISPGSGLLYRDGDVRGDVLSELLVRDLPAHLDDGGYASVLVSWVPGQTDREPKPLAWSAAGGCDSLVLSLHRETAHDAAAAWNDGGDLGAWLDFYRDAGIDEIAYGAVVLRRREGETWRDAIDLPGGPAGHASDHLLRIFAARESLSPGALHQHRFALAPDAMLDGAELSLRRGLGLRAQLDPVGVEVVGRLSPTHPAGAAFDAAARALRRDRATLRELGEALVRRLVELGFVVRAP
jgi:methylase of polypeptide subunit release factors